MTWEPATFRNYYRCEHSDPARTGHGTAPSEWTDDWSCMCNDKCPVCNAEIEPYRSEDLF